MSLILRPTTRRHLNLFSKILLILLVFVTGILINRISLDRLPPGEDDMAYLGSVRRIVDFKVEKADLSDVITNPENKLFLFYSLGKLWELAQDNVTYLAFFNVLYFLFYLAAFLSFYRLGSIGTNKFSNKLLASVWFVLLVSNTFWLGPRYFVPFFWLYISLPNIIVAVLRRRYVEALLWTASNYLIYWYGVGLGLGVFITAMVFKVFEKFWLRVLLFIGGLGVFYLGVLPYVAKFLTQINFKSIIPEDLVVMHYLFAAYSLVAVLILLVSYLKKQIMQWGVFLTSLFLATIFYWTVNVFPQDTASYRLIVIFYVAFGLLFAALPNFQFDRRNLKGMIFDLLVVSTIGGVLLAVLILNLNQNSKDFRSFAIRPEEVQLFEQIGGRCKRIECIVVTDVGTHNVGGYFASAFDSLARYDGSWLRFAFESPDQLAKYAYEHGFLTVELIVSKRTTVLYDTSVTNPDQWVSRSYYLKYEDPLTKFPQLSRYYKDYLSYANYQTGLYSFTIPASKLQAQ